MKRFNDLSEQEKIDATEKALTLIELKLSKEALRSRFEDDLEFILNTTIQIIGERRIVANIRP